MKLSYHHGKNFGDALNPYIFNHLLPDFFDDDERAVFIGIGSLIGLKKPKDSLQIIHVFSSGCGGKESSTYGNIPTSLKQYEFHCVRGPKTAELLGLPKEKSIADGAILSPIVFPKDSLVKQKQFDVSYIPHVGSLSFNNNLKKQLFKIGIHTIDPRNEVKEVLSEIVNSKLVIAEAMHGAILADTYRIPWIAVKSYGTINQFKWEDFCESMQLKYTPVKLPSIFSTTYILSIIQERKFIPFKKPLAFILGIILNHYRVSLFNKKLLIAIQKEQGLLSKTSLLVSKQNQLLEVLNQIKKKFS